jgi:hypothetical protein
VCAVPDGTQPRRVYAHVSDCGSGTNPPCDGGLVAVFEWARNDQRFFFGFFCSFFIDVPFAIFSSPVLADDLRGQCLDPVT